MKGFHNYLLAIGLLFTAALAPSGALADAPAILPLQGFLTDADGNPLDGDFPIRFRIYDADTEGNTVFSEVIEKVAVAHGFFTVYLGQVNELDLAIFRENTDLFLGIKVADDKEAAPRLQLGTVPYAAMAQFCGDADTLGGVAPGDLPNAATLCNAGEYLDGDDTCKPVLTQSTVEGFARGVCFDTEGELTGLLDDNYVNEGQANSVNSSMVVDNNLTANDLAPDSVGASEVADGSLTYADTNVDSIQRRVSASCPAGQSIRVISNTGGVTCEIDDTAANPPAVLSAATGGTFYPQGCSTVTNVQSVTVSAPGPGKITVHGVVKIEFDHTVGTPDRLITTISTSATGIDYEYACYRTVATTTPSTTVYESCFTQRIFSVNAAGDYTYYLNACMYEGAAATSDRIFYPTLQALWVP